MAWLEELARESNYKSLRALAVRVRDSKDWPADDARTAETLANRLRDADKCRDLEWWLPGGAGAQLLPALAGALGSAPDDLAVRFQTAKDQSSGASEHLWRFDQFPGLRPLDLRTEEPFPGIPRQLLLPDGPAARLTWWTAPVGAGRTLVGMWLALHAGWQHRADLTWKEVERLPPGRYFIELDEVPNDVEVVSRRNDQLRLCIASRSRRPKASRLQAPVADDRAPSRQPADAGSNKQTTAEPSDKAQQQSDGWVELTTPPADEWLDDLAGWAVSRLEPGSSLNLLEVRKVLQGLEAHTLVDSPGDALGLLGVIARVTPETLASVDSAEGTSALWRAWLDSVLQRGLEESTHATAGQSVDRVQELTLRLVTARVEAGLPALNRLATWRQLMPSDVAPALNPGELRELVRNNPPDLRERLAELLATDAEAAIKSLIHKRILEREGEVWRLGPRWAQRSLALLALHTLMQSVRGIGALLLGEIHAEQVMEVLLQIASGPSAGELLAFAHQADTSTPEGAAVVAGAQIAFGISAALGHPIRVDDLKQAWVELGLPLVQRYTAYPAAPPILKQEMGNDGGLFSLELWYFAAMVTSLRLAEAGLPVDRMPFDVDAPEGSPSRDSLERSLQLAEHLYAANDASKLGGAIRRAMFGFGAALLERHGNRPLQRGQLRCQEPALLVQLAAGNQEVDAQLLPDRKSQLLTLEFEMTALQDTCARQGLTTNEVLAWCWRKWTGEYRNVNQVWPPYAWRSWRQYGESKQDLELVWQSIPTDLIDTGLADFIWKNAWVWPWLATEHWERLFAHWRQEQPPRWTWMNSRSDSPLDYIPDHLLLAAIRSGELKLVHEHVGSTVWERLPHQLMALLDELVATALADAWQCAEQVDPLFQLLRSSPAGLTEELLERTAKWTQQGMPTFASNGWIARWWLTVVDGRRPGWRRAFSLLCERAVEAPPPPNHPP